MEHEQMEHLADKTIQELRKYDSHLTPDERAAAFVALKTLFPVFQDVYRGIRDIGITKKRAVDVAAVAFAKMLHIIGTILKED